MANSASKSVHMTVLCRLLSQCSSTVGGEQLNQQRVVCAWTLPVLMTASNVCSPAVTLPWSAGQPPAGQPQVFGASDVSPKLQLLLYAELSVVQNVSLDGF